MSWPKFSDDFPDDCWNLTDQEFRTHVEGLCWNAKKWLDCRIPKEDVRRFAKHPDAVEGLVAAGYWADEGDHYLIRHHREHQRTRETAIQIQDTARENGKKGGRPRKTQTGTQTKTHLGSQNGTQMETQGEKEKEKEALEASEDESRGDDSVAASASSEAQLSLPVAKVISRPTQQYRDP